MPLPQKKLIPSFLLLLAIAAFAVPPLWWSAGDPPVIAPGAPENNQGPANIGQAKHMAKSTLDALRPILPAVADEIEADLTGGTNPILDFTVPDPKTQAWIDQQKAPLLIGQLKAIAAPFYTRLHTAAPIWLEAERTAHGTNHPGSIFPWTSATTDDNNKGMANIGQLKAAFSLRFDHDADIDGMPGLWEEANGLDQHDPGDADTDLDDDGLTNLEEYGIGTDPGLDDSDWDGMPDNWEKINGLKPADPSDADTDLDDDGLTNLEEFENETDPANTDTDGDGTTDGDEVLQGNSPTNPNDKPVAEWFVLTGDLGAGEEKSRSRTVTIPKGESRLLVVALHSAEYPYYTEQFSDFDDLLEWDIRPQGKDPVTGEVNVNDRHTDWELAVLDGVEILGFSPAHIETTEKYSAPGDSDLVIEIDLSATNVSDGALPSTVMVGLLPVEVKDNLVEIQDAEAPGGVSTVVKYTGVDDISKTADAIDNGYVEDFWIMAPLQAPPVPNGADYENLTRFRIGMGDGNTGGLSCENGTPIPTSLDLEGDFKPMLWRGAGTGVDSSEPVEMSINGSGQKFPLPVKVKAMKYRTINVSVFPVKISAAAPSIELPTEPLLIKNLKEVLGYQINAWCLDPLYKPEQIYNYDPDDDKVLSTDDDAYQLLRDQCSDPDADISIILIGGVAFVDTDDVVLAGQALDDAKPIVVSRDAPNTWPEDPATEGRPAPGSFQVNPRPTAEVVWTMIHEMGHRIIGLGHPDQGGGPATLEGVADTEEVRRRLMCSGPIRFHNPGDRLVKKEWDSAEAWLTEREEARSQQGGSQ